MFKLDQKSPIKRILAIIPLIAAVLGLLIWSNVNSSGFAILWNYFAWANQVIA